MKCMNMPKKGFICIIIRVWYYFLHLPGIFIFLCTQKSFLVEFGDRINILWNHIRCQGVVYSNVLNFIWCQYTIEYLYGSCGTCKWGHLFLVASTDSTLTQTNLIKRNFQFLWLLSSIIFYKYVHYTVKDILFVYIL